MVSMTGQVKVVTKGCADNCLNNRTVVLVGTSITEYCCSTDKCNKATSIFNMSQHQFGFFVLISLATIFKKPW